MEATSTKISWPSSLALVLALGVAACRGPIPCPDCDGAADDMQEDPVPDLPCGGADLLTDPLNCGSCGHACSWLAGTEWDAGTCEDGTCVPPFWGDCEGEGLGATCGEICAAYATTCVANGCAGHTGLLFLVGGLEQSCAYELHPYATLDGSCDEPIQWHPPWEDDISIDTKVMCCCG